MKTASLTCLSLLLLASAPMVSGRRANGVIVTQLIGDICLL